MSAAPVYPEQKPSRAPSRPSVPSKSRPVRRPQGKSWTQVFVANVTLFTLATTLTFGFSTLLGHSMKEAARHEAIRDGDRARSARSDMARIRSRIERMSTMRSVDDWSKLNGFVTGMELAQKLVKPAPSGIKAAAKPKSEGLKVDVVVARVDDGTTAR